jgi:hypothetical protein
MTKPGENSTEEKQAAATKLAPEQAALLASVTATENSLAGATLEHDADGNLIEQEAEPVDKAAGNRALLAALVATAGPALPFIPRCYTPEVIENIANAFTAVEEKYGWDVGSNIGPELALAVFALPPTIAAVVLGRAHFAELKAQREAAAGQKPKGPNEQGIDGVNAGAIGG